MTRWVGRGIALLLLAGLVLFPAIRWPSLGGVERDTATITSYVADSTVAKDGRITVTETLRVNFPDYKHGIFRFFDVQDPGDSHVRLVPHHIAVSRDGRAEPFEVLAESKGRYRNVKIGSADTVDDGRARLRHQVRHRRCPRRHLEGSRRLLLEPDRRRLADADPGLPAHRAPAREVRRR